MQGSPLLAAGQTEPVRSEDQNGRIGANIYIRTHAPRDSFGLSVDAVDNVQNKRQLAIVSPPPTEHTYHARKRFRGRLIFPNAAAKFLLTESFSWIELWCVQLLQKPIHFLTKQLIELDTMLRP